MMRIKKDGVLGVITLENAKLNVLNSKELRALLLALKKFDGDKAVHVIILTGGPKVFSAGADMGEMVRFDRSKAVRFAKLGKSVVQQIMRGKPVIAAVEGYVLGGAAEIVTVCDYVVAGKSAQFGQPEVNVGLIPGFGGTQILRRTIGGRAKGIILRGNLIGSSEAQQAGLFNEVVKNGKALEKAKKVGQEIARNSPKALARAKKLINSWNLKLAEETKAFAACFGPEQKKRMQAFLKK